MGLEEINGDIVRLLEEEITFSLQELSTVPLEGELIRTRMNQFEISKLLKNKVKELYEYEEYVQSQKKDFDKEYSQYLSDKQRTFSESKKNDIKILEIRRSEKLLEEKEKSLEKKELELDIRSEKILKYDEKLIIKNSEIYNLIQQQKSEKKGIEKMTEDIEAKLKEIGSEWQRLRAMDNCMKEREKELLDLEERIKQREEEIEKRENAQKQLEIDMKDRELDLTLKEKELNRQAKILRIQNWED